MRGEGLASACCRETLQKGYSDSHAQYGVCYPAGFDQSFLALAFCFLSWAAWTETVTASISALSPGTSLSGLGLTVYWRSVVCCCALGCRLLQQRDARVHTCMFTLGKQDLGRKCCLIFGSRSFAVLDVQKLLCLKAMGKEGTLTVLLPRCCWRHGFHFLSEHLN